MAETNWSDIASKGMEQLVAMLAAQQKARADAAQYDQRLALTTGSGLGNMYENQLNRDTNQTQLAANLSQQDPFFLNNLRQRELMKQALFEGQDVGPGFRSAAPMPGVEYLGSIPKLSFNAGTYAPRLGTDEVLAGEEAKQQILQKLLQPKTPVTPLGSVWGAGGAAQDPLVAQAGQQQATWQQQTQDDERAALMQALAMNQGDATKRNTASKVGKGLLTGASIASSSGLTKALLGRGSAPMTGSPGGGGGSDPLSGISYGNGPNGGILDAHGNEWVLDGGTGQWVNVGGASPTLIPDNSPRQSRWVGPPRSR